MVIKIDYKNKPMESLSENELERCAEIYSENYGKYAANAPWRPGEKIKMGVGQYKKRYVKPDFYIAMALSNDIEIAHAIYLRKNISNGQKMTWVVQLVVHEKYRRQGIGRKLLNSIWGLSSDAAWGLASSNPFTVKTLEASTFRKVSPEEILKHLSSIKEMGELVGFVNEYKVDKKQSVVDSRFFVDLEDLTDNIDKAFGSENWLLGKLEPGQEWLAFTFADQGFCSEYEGDFANFMAFSEEKLKDAYGRMEYEQPWRKHTDKEVKYIINQCQLSKGMTVIDFGCGEGRHSISLAKQGIKAIGIDFSADNVTAARKQAGELENIVFKKKDCRGYINEEKSDAVIALYDVIGSFPEEKENLEIVKNAHKNLKDGGYFVLSVMNMELTMHNVKPEHIGKDIEKNPRILQKLKASNIMQSSGDVFDPEYYVLDTKKNLIYRKEQFENDGVLSAEYIIRDKRYTMQEITGLVKQCGFEILKASYVQAGRWETELGATDNRAKEILLVAKKV